MTESIKVDVLVIGSGAAGMAAALKAADEGHSVLVVEKRPHWGGTSAICGGWGWLPGNSRDVEMGDTREETLEYLRAVAPDSVNEDLVGTFLEAVPEAMRFYEDEGLEVVYGALAPDYQMDAPGARERGRAVTFKKMDARILGSDRLMVEDYLMPFTVYGYMPEIGDDMAKMLKANQSLPNFIYASRKILTAWLQIALFKRALTRTNGNGLMTWMFAQARKAGIRIWAGTKAVELLTDEAGTVTGARISGEHTGTVQTRLGVILATGGFSNSPELRKQFFAHDPNGDDHFPPTIGHDGDAYKLAKPLGGHIDNSGYQPAGWSVVTTFRSLIRRKPSLFPHLRAFGLPGLIAVDREGKRFANESLSYHDYGVEMIENDAHRPKTYGWIIADSKAMRRYGIGYAKPWPFPQAIFIKEGFLIRAKSLAELAKKIDMPAQTLAETVREFNEGAAVGVDHKFQRGSLKYHHFKGDMDHKPNPNLAVLDKAPYFAVKMKMGDLGTFSGLEVNERSEVLGTQGNPIPGLYAVGTAAVSIFGGGYPGYGANIGPGLVFGYLVGRDIAAHAAERG